MRYLFVSLLLITISCATAYSSETGHLSAYIISSKVRISTDDVNDIYLKYNKEQKAYIIYLIFSKNGVDKFNSLIKGKKGKDLTLVFSKNVLVGPIPMMTDNIENPFTIVTKSKESAIAVLEGLSK